MSHIITYASKRQLILKDPLIQQRIRAVKKAAPYKGKESGMIIEV